MFSVFIVGIFIIDKNRQINVIGLQQFDYIFGFFFRLFGRGGLLIKINAGVYIVF